MTQEEKKMIEEKNEIAKELQAVRKQISEAWSRNDMDAKRELIQKENDLMHKDYHLSLLIAEHQRKQYRCMAENERF